jgi:hypothetical protein
MSVKHTFKYLTSTAAGIVETQETRNLTSKAAIKFHCLDCAGGVKQDITTCHIKLCPLWPFRPYAKSKIRPQKG